MRNPTFSVEQKLVRMRTLGGLFYIFWNKNAQLIFVFFRTLMRAMTCGKEGNQTIMREMFSTPFALAGICRG